MQDITFQTHIARRAQSLDLPIANFLLPLFEAISNSLYAIGDPHPNDSKMILTVNRENEQASLLGDSDRENLDILGFDIEDNGEGFTLTNYTSFCTDSSPLKEATGGKGVGRFTWLKAFDSVHIESYFQENNLPYKRTIFLDSQNQKSSMKLAENPHQDGTVVSLRGFKAEYRKIKKFGPLCDNIIEHFFPYFYEEKMPSIEIHDGENIVNLNKIYKEMVSGKTHEETLDIDGNTFKILHLFHKKHINGAYKINLCAFQRFVVSKTLEEIDAWFTDLNGRMISIDDDNFYYSAFVFSDFLNIKVNSERTGFHIPDKKSQLINAIALHEIYTCVSDRIKQFLKPHIKEAQEAKINRVSSYIMKDAPVYSHLIGYMKDEFTKIPLTSSKEKIDIELHKMNYKFERSLKAEGNKLSKAIWEESEDYTSIYEKINNHIEKNNAVGKSKLASYIIHRKSMLLLFSKALQKNEELKYNREDFLHKIICPMGKESTELQVDQHNLWIVDERLVSHSFLASDKKIQSLPIPSKSLKEPDIIAFFDSAMAYGNSETSRAGVILEFKKPMRDDYAMGGLKDPIKQIGNYSRSIQEGSEVTFEGRPLKAADRVYAYLICDITPTLVDILHTYGFRKTFDGEGYFLPDHPHFHCYFEVLPYSKLLSDAVQRNTMFFEQLGIRGL